VKQIRGIRFVTHSQLFDFLSLNYCYGVWLCPSVRWPRLGLLHEPRICEGMWSVCWMLTETRNTEMLQKTQSLWPHGQHEFYVVSPGTEPRTPMVRVWPLIPSVIVYTKTYFLDSLKRLTNCFRVSDAFNTRRSLNDTYRVSRGVFNKFIRKSKANVQKLPRGIFLFPGFNRS
jgi:hypothetical protein